MIITQRRKSYRFWQMQQNTMSHVLQAVPADAERKESSAMQRHVASVTVLTLIEDVSPFSRS